MNKINEDIQTDRFHEVCEMLSKYRPKSNDTNQEKHDPLWKIEFVKPIISETALDKIKDIVNSVKVTKDGNRTEVTFKYHIGDVIKIAYTYTEHKDETTEAPRWWSVYERMIRAVAMTIIEDGVKDANNEYDAIGFMKEKVNQVFDEKTESEVRYNLDYLERIKNDRVFVQSLICLYKWHARQPVHEEDLIRSFSFIMFNRYCDDIEETQKYISSWINTAKRDVARQFSNDYECLVRHY